MKIVFIGTTEFGMPTLEKISAPPASPSEAERAGGKNFFDIVLIITQPDRPSGRKQTVTPPPIKLWAEKNHIPVLQPEKIINLKSEIKNLNPDLLLVAAYGQLISQDILAIPKFGSINIHGSILPKYRGASPIQTAIANGDNDTGVTLILMDEQMDHGPIIAVKKCVIENNDNYLSLYKKLAGLSADLVMRVLPKWFEKQIIYNPQNEELATYTKMVTKKDIRIHWTDSAQSIHNLIRAYNPEPGPWTMFLDKKINIIETDLINETKIELPGKLYSDSAGLAVKCGDYSLLLKQVQPEGKNKMSGKDFRNGIKSFENKIFI